MATTITIYEFGPDGPVPVGTFTLTGDAEARYLAPDRVREAYQTLRQWSIDAAQVNTDWPTMTAGQKDSAMRETIRRLGILLDRFADVLYLQGELG